MPAVPDALPDGPPNWYGPLIANGYQNVAGAEMYKLSPATIFGTTAEMAAWEAEAIVGGRYFDTDLGIDYVMTADGPQPSGGGVGAVAVGAGLEAWDDFERSNGALGAAPSGQTWLTSGPGTPLISGGKVVSTTTGNSYCQLVLEDDVVHAGWEFRFPVGASSTAVAGTIAIGQGPSITEVIDNCAHIQMSRSALKIQKRVGGVQSEVAGRTLVDVIPDDGRTIRMDVRVSGGTASLSFTDTVTGKSYALTAADSALAGLIGPAVFWEPTKGASGDVEMLSAWAYTARTQPQAPSTVPTLGETVAVAEHRARYITAESSSQPALRVRAAGDADDGVRFTLFPYGFGFGNGSGTTMTEMVQRFSGLFRSFVAWTVERTATNLTCFGAWVTGDTQYRWQVTADGIHRFGPGGATAADTLWYREGVAVMGVGASGMIRTGRFANVAALPSAVTAGAGATAYVVAISKPVWSDGSVWRDAAGTAV